jgi:hypothetical protein
MKRTSVALGILGLVYAVAMPTASAAVLLQEDFNDGKFEGVAGIYKQGLAAGIVDADGNPGEPFTIRQFDVVDGVATLAEPGTAITSGVLDAGNGDGIAAEPDLTVAHRILLLTGEPTWADVAIQSRVFSLDQTTGVIGLVLRAAPRTKPEDPNTWYEFRYTTDISAVTQEEVDSGINPPEGESASDPIATNLRILKVVAGKWTMLAEVNTTLPGGTAIPHVNNNGEHHPNMGGTGMIMRFVAKGSVLQGFVGLPGGQMTKALEVNDTELKAGRVGYHSYDYRPLSDDLLIEDAP